MEFKSQLKLYENQQKKLFKKFIKLTNIDTHENISFYVNEINNSKIRVNFLIREQQLANSRIMCYDYFNGSRKEEISKFIFDEWKLGELRLRLIDKELTIVKKIRFSIDESNVNYLNDCLHLKHILMKLHYNESRLQEELYDHDSNMEL